MTWKPDYAAVADLKRVLRIPATDTDDDAELALAITAASRSIDRYTTRQFGKVASAEARYYTLGYDRESFLNILVTDDFMSTAGMTVEADNRGDYSYALAITTYSVGPRNAAQTGMAWDTIAFLNTVLILPHHADAFKVTAVWGWTAVPDAIKAATLLQAARLYKRRDAPFGIAGSPETGSEMRLLAKLDPDVEIMAGPYRRWVIA